MSQAQSQPMIQTPVTIPYLDPEGGYGNQEVGRAAELAAMTNWPKMNVNHLPTKQYLDATITPTILKALSEVS